jgi:hypothetical protein
VSTYLDGNKFTDFLAKLDPTSSKIGGQIVKGALSVAGTFVGIPPTVTYGGLTGIGKVTGSVKASQKAAQNPPLQVTESVPQGYSPLVNMGSYQVGVKPTSDPRPLIITSAAAVAILATILLLKK